MSEPPADQAPTLRDGAPDSVPPTELSVGQPFGRYRLMQKLGQGGMGVVWRAYDTQLKRVVALKQILRGEEDPKTAERFLREAQAAARRRGAPRTRRGGQEQAGQDAGHGVPSHV